MADATTKKILLKHYNNFIAKEHPYLKAVINPENIYEWYFMIYNILGDDDRFKGGEYILYVKAMNNYPYSPPEFRFMTPNGLYEINSSICLDISKYHMDTSRPILSLDRFAEQLYGAMICAGDVRAGISIIVGTKVDTYKKLARDSKKYNNEHNKIYLDMINNSYNEYSKKWAKEELPINAAQQSSLMNSFMLMSLENVAPAKVKVVVQDISEKNTKNDIVEQKNEDKIEEKILLDDKIVVDNPTIDSKIIAPKKIPYYSRFGSFKL